MTESTKFAVLTSPENVNMSDDWYALTPDDHFWMQWRNNLLLEKVSSCLTEGQIALDVGCGRRGFANLLEKRCRVICDGCDLNVHALNSASPGQGQTFSYDVTKLDPRLEKKIRRHIYFGCS